MQIQIQAVTCIKKQRGRNKLTVTVSQQKPDPQRSVLDMDKICKEKASVRDPNKLNLDPDPGFWPNLDPDPGLQ